MSWCGVRVGVWLAGGRGVRLGAGWLGGSVLWGLCAPLGLVGRLGVPGVVLFGGLCCGPVFSEGPGLWPWVLWPRLLPLPVSVRWPLLWPGSSPGDRGRGGGLRGYVLGGFLCECSPPSPCRCALLPRCGFWWFVGVSRCGPYGVRFMFLGACASGGRGMPFLRVDPGARRCVLFLCASVSVPSPSGPMGGLLFPCCVALRALSLWAPARHFGPFLAPLPECPFLSLAPPFPVPIPFPVWRWWGGWGACGVPMAQAWG